MFSGFFPLSCTERPGALWNAFEGGVPTKVPIYRLSRGVAELDAFKPSAAPPPGFPRPRDNRDPTALERVREAAEIVGCHSSTLGLGGGGVRAITDSRSCQDSPDPAIIAILRRKPASVRPGWLSPSAAGERKMHRPERNSAKSNKSPFGSQDSTQRRRRFIQWRLSKRCPDQPA